MDAEDAVPVDCDEVLRRVYEYLDQELSRKESDRTRLHLDECSPCLQKYDLEQAVKAVLQRSCQCESVELLPGMMVCSSLAR